MAHPEYCTTGSGWTTDPGEFVYGGIYNGYPYYVSVDGFGPGVNAYIYVFVGSPRYDMSEVLGANAGAGTTYFAYGPNGGVIGTWNNMNQEPLATTGSGTIELCSGISWCTTGTWDPDITGEWVNQGLNTTGAALGGGEETREYYTLDKDGTTYYMYWHNDAGNAWVISTVLNVSSVDLNWTTDVLFYVNGGTEISYTPDTAYIAKAGGWTSNFFAGITVGDYEICEATFNLSPYFHLIDTDQDEVRTLSGLEISETAEAAHKLSENRLTTVVQTSGNTIKQFDITSIPNSWYYQDSTIKTVVFGNKVTSIGINAFFNIIDTSPAAYAPGYSNGPLVQELQLPTNPNFTTLPRQGFTGQDNIVGTLIIPSNIQTSGDDGGENRCFQGCTAITELIFEEGIHTIGSRTFQRLCSVNHVVVLPNSLESYSGQPGYGGLAFSECINMTGVVFPNNPNFKIIPYGQFAYCFAMNTDIVIPDSVEEVHSYVFAEDTLIPNIYCNLPASGWQSLSLNNCGSGSSVIYVHSDYVSGYDGTWLTNTGFNGTVATWNNYPNPVPN